VSDEYSVHGRFLMGKIDEAEYLRKMEYMQERADEFETEIERARYRPDHPCRGADGVIRCPKCGNSMPCENYGPGCP
jgi:hypothetical protein